ncbi:MAG: hypothetical protein FJY56_10700 [Betaproteobacteria bacterium]|nr:hypothetical protein [Betaproteobacteria bacterium]
MKSPQKPSWLMRIMLSIAAVALLIVAFFFLAAALIAGALIALVVGVRVWWTLRKFKRELAQREARGDGDGGTGAPLDGEYQVVERETTAKPLPGAEPTNNTPPER